MGRPLVGGAFEVWTRPERLVQIPWRRDWRFRVRSGKDADGSRAQKTMTSKSMPLAARRAAASEVMAFLKAKGQVRYPPAITTEAQRGHLVMAYQSAEAPSESCEGDGPILIRLRRPRARARPGAKRETAPVVQKRSTSWRRQATRRGSFRMEISAI